MVSLFTELGSEYVYLNFNYPNISPDYSQICYFLSYNLASMKSKFSVFNSDYITERKCKKHQNYCWHLLDWIFLFHGDPMLQSRSTGQRPMS